MNKNLRAYHKQVNWAGLSGCQWVKHQHSNFEQGVVCADAHVHERNKSKHLGKKLKIKCHATFQRSKSEQRILNNTWFTLLQIK